ncbi:MAG: TonB-dependent receptor [Bacteroidota bacterium]|nr:TonB-dependent receptor [Bacteroidota bacterium]
MRVFIFISLLVILFLQTAFSGIYGILEGTLKDRESGQVLPGVNVLIVGTTMGTVTDVNGYYQISNVKASTYDVQFSLIGYRTALQKGITVAPDLRTKINVALTATDIELNEIEVIAERPLIQRDVTSTTYNVGSVRLEKLPVTSLQEVLTLQPGVTLEGHVRGGKTSEVLYFVDGLPIQDVIGGGAGAELPKSAITEMSIQTGGFDAEYGNALSGIVNIITKTSTDRHKFQVRLDKDNWLGGKQVSKVTDAEISASGPIIQNFGYFTAFNLHLTDTRWWQDFQHFFDYPIQRELSNFSKLDYNFGNGKRLSLSSLSSFKRWHDYEFSWRFNLDGLPPRSRDAIRVSAAWNHSLSEKTFYNVSLSLYSLNQKINEGSKYNIDTSVYQYDFYLQYITEGSRAWWVNQDQNIYTLKADITSQIVKSHLFKVGFEFNQYSIFSDMLKYEPRKTYYGKPLVSEPQLNYSSNYKYYPRSGSFYIQDKFDEEGFTLNIGGRFDFLDPTAERPLVENIADIDSLTRDTTYRQGIAKFIKSKFKYSISPRIGLSAPIDVNGYIFINYGEYFQFPLFDYLYSGLNNVAISKGARALVGNPDLLPEKTKAWEISVKYIFWNQLVVSATYFNKNTTNQIDTKTLIPLNSRYAGDFGFAEYVNNPYAEANGLELSVSREHGEYLNGTISYTYMVAKGLSEYVNQSLNYAQWGFALFPKPFYLSWDQRHTVKGNIEFSLPSDLFINVLFQFNTPKPYTHYPTKDGFNPPASSKDSTLIKSFIPNNARMKDFSNIDIKASKKIVFGFMKNMKLYVYVDFRNVLNAKNVRWVDSNGRIGGELDDPSAYYQPRRTRAGIRLEF